MLSESASPATALSVPFSSSFSSFSSFVLHVPVVYPSAHLQLPVHSLSTRKIYPPAVIRIFFASRWTVLLVIPLTSITNLLLRPGWAYFFHRRLFHQQSSPITLVIVAAAKETKKENVKAAFRPTKKESTHTTNYPLPSHSPIERCAICRLNSSRFSTPMILGRACLIAMSGSRMC